MSFDSLNVQKSPKSPGGEISEKTKKYDRQLRLWGDHGQVAIENAHVCLINATATGTEFLKSLVLPGIGAFTIIDGGKVTGEDVGNNFFYDASSIGNSKAKVASQLLLEMNSDVRGDFIDETVENVLETNPKLFSNFNVVVATGIMSEKTVVKLSELLWKANVPLMLCKSYGLIGVIQLQTIEHTVIEAHPDSMLEDLRLDDPFPELKGYLDSFDLNSMSRADLSHTPYLIVLYSYLRQWQSKENNPKLPQNYKEKNELRTLIKDGAEHFKNKFLNSDGEESRELDLDNFAETVKAVNNVLVDSKAVPSETRAVLEASNSLDNNKFWILVSALKEFIQRYGSLPVRGTVPDMTADSARYIQLQKLYSTKAKKDSEAFFSLLQEICERVGKSAEQEYSDFEVKLFCKNAHHLNVIRTSPISSAYAQEHKQVSDNIKNTIASQELAGDSDSLIVFYLLIRATEKFYSKYNRQPGETSDEIDSDIVMLKACFKEVLNEVGIVASSKDDYIQEMVRFGGSELHSVAAFVGANAAHEAIKLVTGQYVPFNNLLIYDAMNSATATYQL
ncbi:Nedd8-activating enzyme E1 regulatory subunit [Halotydeus destructor]|nr:Nedd8-activating enzyme E1 regulatory subunit [Halotydeus destructor]